MKRILLTAGWVYFICIAEAQQPSFDIKNLVISWEVVENNYQKKAQFQSAFTITNKSKTVFPSGGWSLYFNFVRSVFPESATGGVNIEHVNGDLFRIIPSNDFAGIQGGRSLRIEFTSGAWAVNFTDAPAGLYIVWDTNPEKGFPVQAYSIVLSTEPRQYLRSPDDKIGLTTPSMVFEENSMIRDVESNELPKIFPTTVSYLEREGEFVINSDVEIVTHKNFQREANYLAEELAKITGVKPPVLPGSSAGLKKRIFLDTAKLQPEAYKLLVNSSRIEIRGATVSGIFYGIQSLKTLLPPESWRGKTTSVTVPAVEVEDSPRFAHRALMLDVARNFQSKQQVIKLLDLMSLYKLNVLHFHFNDDEGWRLEIPGLEELTSVGARRGHTLDSKTHLPPSYGSGPDVNNSYGSGHYTKTDFIEILTYAKERHIEVIPEIETPGHARAAVKAMDARYERLMKEGKEKEARQYLLRDLKDESTYRSVQLWNDNVMNVALPSTYNFLEKVVDEIRIMYQEAGAALRTIHFGGDEVPAGVWEKSPACMELIKDDPTVENVDDLWYYYFNNVNKMLRSKGLFLSGWEEIGMRKTTLDGNRHMIPNPDFSSDNFQVDVWNNVLGWGAEDLAYQLANAGYKVVLSCVSNLYFDMAYQKSFEEPGYYWGAYVDLDEPFYFIPFDYFKNSRKDRLGNPLNKDVFIGKDRLTAYGKSNIVGIQGLLWAETVQGPERMEYMILPKLFGLAERAWAKDPQWATEKDSAKAEKLYREAWSSFVNVLGKRELPRLDHYAGGFAYRIPTAGASIKDDKVWANVQLPGFTIRYTANGKEPTLKSKLYTSPIAEKGEIRLKVFNNSGRGGRTVVVRH